MHLACPLGGSEVGASEGLQQQQPELETRSWPQKGPHLRMPGSVKVLPQQMHAGLVAGCPMVARTGCLCAEP